MDTIVESSPAPLLGIPTESSSSMPEVSESRTEGEPSASPIPCVGQSLESHSEEETSSGVPGENLGETTAGEIAPEGDSSGSAPTHTLESCPTGAGIPGVAGVNVSSTPAYLVGKGLGRTGSGVGGRSLGRTYSPMPRVASGGGVVMEPLVEALEMEDVEKVREAAGAIRLSLKNNPENKARLLAAGGLDKLIQLLLESEDSATVEHCVTALLNMSLTQGVEPLITSAGGIEAIVGVLERGSPVSKENAAAALFTLSGPMENKVRVRDAGAIPALVALLKTGSLRGKKDACLALFNLTLEEQCVGHIVSEGTVQVLVSLLGNSAEPEMAGMEDKIMAVVANLCKFAEGRQAVHTEGGISAMVDVMDGGSPRAQEDAAVSLHLMAVHNPASFQLILEEGAMPALVKLGHSGTPRAKSKAKALLELLRGYASQNSGSFSYSNSYSRSFGKAHAPTLTGDLKDRGLTGEIRGT